MDFMRNRRRLMIAFALLGVTSFVALAAMLGTGLHKVHAGDWLEPYRTSWLVEFNWVAFLVLVAAMLVALVGGGIVSYIEWRENRPQESPYE